MFGFLANRATGQGTSALPNPRPPRFLSDLPSAPAATANLVTPVAAAAQVRATDPARITYEQQMASLQRCFDQQAALQRHLDQQDEFLRQAATALENRSREQQQRQQSLIGRGGYINPANLFQTPQDRLIGGAPAVQATGQVVANPPAPA